MIKDKGCAINVVIILASMIYFLYIIIPGTIEAVNLAKHGKVTKGVITHYYHIGSKATYVTEYKFMYKGKIYFGENIYVFDKKVGDSLNVLFLEENPKINIYYEHLHNDPLYSWLFPE
ncbi:MAG: hypothetical protein ACM34K_00620 [Bacillota bacterium]